MALRTLDVKQRLADGEPLSSDLVEQVSRCDHGGWKLAQELVGSRASPGDTPILLEAMNDPSLSLSARWCARMLLAALGEDVVDQVEAFLDGEVDDRARGWAEELLADLAGPDRPDDPEDEEP